jgi:hypothetical protein
MPRRPTKVHGASYPGVLGEHPPKEDGHTKDRTEQICFQTCLPWESGTYACPSEAGGMGGFPHEKWVIRRSYKVEQKSILQEAPLSSAVLIFFISAFFPGGKPQDPRTRFAGTILRLHLLMEPLFSLCPLWIQIRFISALNAHFELRRLNTPN